MTLFSGLKTSEFDDDNTARGTDVLYNDSLTASFLNSGSLDSININMGMTAAWTGVHTFLSTQLKLRSSGAAFDLIFAVTTVFTANRTLTIEIGDSNRTLTFNNNFTYSEGTFSPTVTLVGGAGNTVPVYTTNHGRYSRIGRLCFVDIELLGDGGAEGAGTGAIRIALPFAVSASATEHRAIGGRLANGSATYPIEVVMSPNDTTVGLAYQAVVGTNIIATGADQNNTSRNIVISFWYEL